MKTRNGHETPKKTALARFNEVPKCVEEYLMITSNVWPEVKEVYGGALPASHAPEWMKTACVVNSIVQMIIRHHDAMEWALAEIEKLRAEVESLKIDKGKTTCMNP